jgi:protein pelota
MAMRVIHKDLRHGEIRLQIQNLDDLWHLDNLVQPGDLVRAMTARRQEDKGDKLRPERMDKTKMLLGIRVEKVEFHEFADYLRISGVIEEGPQDHGAHHTLNLTFMDDLTIVKEWRESELQRIEEAVAAAQKPLISLLSLDDDDATIAQLRQYGLREVATIHAPGHGKMFPTADGKQTYFEEILEKLRQSQLAETLVVLGPGFAREEFIKFLNSKDPDIARKTRGYGTGHAGMQGINESLKSGLGAKIFEETRVGQETKLVEQLLEEIGKDGLYAYGPAEVEDAISSGAVTTLLVLEDRLRSRETEELLRRVERQSGKVVVISGHHEAGKKLEALGGVGAFLRFKIG